MKRKPIWTPPPAADDDRLKAATCLAAGLLAALLLMLAAGAAGQEPEDEPTAPSSDVATPLAAPASPRTDDPAPAGTEARKPTGSPSTPPRAPGRRPGKGTRTLDEITIEGEIAVPQVLFITARERKHYRDFLHRNYLKSSRELCREIPVPVRLGSWIWP